MSSELSGVATQKLLDELMRQFYAVISFDEGGAPDWSCMETLFSQHARITRVTPEAIDYMDLEGFRRLAEELIEVGAFTSFYEHEVPGAAISSRTSWPITSAASRRRSP